MTALDAVTVAIAIAWAIVAASALLADGGHARYRLAALCLLAAATSAAAGWGPLAPLALPAWLAYALAAPDGILAGRLRWGLIAVAGAGALGWSVSLAPGSASPDVVAYTIAAAGVGVIASIGAVLRYRRASVDDRSALQWLAAGAVIAAGFVVVVLTLHVIVDSPRVPEAWVVGALVLVPLGQLAALLSRDARLSAVALIESVAVSGVAVLVAVVYLVVVAGINGVPHGHERGVLIASLVAAIAVAVLALPVHDRLVTLTKALVGDRNPSTEDVATAFSARMSRAVPMDELLLQLVESLRATVASAGAEIWTGTSGTLIRAVSMPDRGTARLQLGDRDRVVVGSARAGGHSWTSMWLPGLLAADGSDLRVVPIAHLGELLGLIVVRRPADDSAFTEQDERPLVELARQLGLALHNVRLDSALQASLAELAERNAELQASRLRIVTAADASRRMIERNLHDGAQQHLVALAVKIGLAQQIAEDGDLPTVQGMLVDLRADVQTTIKELRELAHGIYPPLLRDRGLGEALRTAATRSPLACTVEVDLPGRFPEEIETAAYFCCLEAMQNAGKYAGDTATLHVHVSCQPDQLCLELVDDGAGFDVDATAAGHGFVNMRDRLGAIGGELVIESSPGQGTTVRATIPARPLEQPALATVRR